MAETEKNTQIQRSAGEPLPEGVNGQTAVRRRKKKNIRQKFLQIFLKSFGVIILLCLTGFVSYKTTMFCFDQFGGPSDDKSAKLIRELYGEVEIKDISKNLIYAIDGDNQIKAMVLEVLNTNTHNMDYITIPMKSEFTMSNELYQKLCASGSEAPQIIKISKIDSYFKGDTLYQYGVILLEDMLGLDVDYYTAVSAEEFVKMFKSGKAEAAHDKEGNEITSPVEYKLRKSYLKKISTLTSEKELKDYIKEQLSRCTSNLTTRNKMEYAAEYRLVEPQLIYTHSLYGVTAESTFSVDADSSRELLAQILNNTESYTTAQSQLDKTESQPGSGISAGYNIQILNASQINGLAAKYEEILEADGYTVTNIANYAGNIQRGTKIIVKEDGLGEDLALYIEGASVESGQTPSGIDIQIILGTDADIE